MTKFGEFGDYCQTLLRSGYLGMSVCRVHGNKLLNCLSTPVFDQYAEHMKPLGVIPERFAMDHLHLLWRVRVVNPVAELLYRQVSRLRGEVPGDHKSDDSGKGS